jgi:hypothetical protein
MGQVALLLFMFLKCFSGASGYILCPLQLSSLLAGANFFLFGEGWREIIDKKVTNIYVFRQFPDKYNSSCNVKYWIKRRIL